MSLALTFDDGPDPRWTPRLLDILAELKVPATFFPIATRARAHPEIVERMRAEGHELGLHGALHLDHTLFPSDLVEYDTELALELMGEPRPQLWRLPYGRLAPVSVHLAGKHRLELVAWTHNTRDYVGTITARRMLAEAADQLDDGAIILMHDAVGPRSGRDAELGGLRSSCEPTLELVPLLVEAARIRGLECGLIDSTRSRPPAAPHVSPG